MSHGLRGSPPPRNLEAERSVLGGILLDNYVLHDVVLILEPEDFYRESHQTIYRAILTLYNAGKPVDAVSLADQLELQGRFQDVGGFDILVEITNSVPHAENAKHHAEIVRQKSMSRQLIQGCTELIDSGYSNLFTAQQLIEEAEKKIYAIAERQVTGATRDGKALAEEFNKNLERLSHGEVVGLGTGYADIDNTLLGMRPGDLIVLAGRPSSGKSSLAMNLAWHVAYNEKASTLFVSLETKREAFCDRLIGSLAGIDTRAFRSYRLFKDLTSDETARHHKASSWLHNSRLRVDDTSDQTLSQISANARRLKLRESLSLVVIDYLGYINEKQQPRENLTDTLGRITKGLKTLAKELKVPILLLHQLNRDSEKEQRKPRMSDLRSSGNIEQDADVIMLLHSTLQPGDTHGLVELVVAKNRDGPTGIVKLNFNKVFTRFDAWAKPGQIEESVVRTTMYSEDIPDGNMGTF